MPAHGRESGGFHGDNLVAQPISGTLEENVLTTLCWSDEFSLGVRLRVDPDLFSTVHYRDIAREAATYIDAYGRPPGPHMRDILAEKTRGSRGELLERVLVQMELLAPKANYQFVINELDGFLKEREFDRLLIEADEAKSEFGVDAGIEKINELMGKQRPHLTDGGIWLADPEQALKFLKKDEAEFFSSGITVLDEMGIRPAPKTLFMLMAPAKRGKSWWLINVGKHAVIHRRKVLHVTLEMSEEQVARRYLQSLFSMTQSKTETVRIPTFTKSVDGGPTMIDFDSFSADGINTSTEDQVTAKLRRFGGRLQILIKEFPTSSLSISELRGYLDFLRRTRDFVPDLLVVDYVDLMKVTGKDLRVAVGNVVKELRGLGVERELAVVTVTQTNRGSARSKVVHSDMVAEDWSKVATADVVLTLNQTSEERAAGLARILVAAARDAMDQMMVLVSQSYAVGQFCIDSILMTSSVRTEADRFIGDQD